MLHYLRFGVKFLRTLLVVQSPGLALELIGKTDAHKEIQSTFPPSGVLLRSLGLTVDPLRHRFMIEGFDCALRLKEKCSAKFIINGSNCIEVSFEGLRIELTTLGDLMLVDEIFCQLQYSMTFAEPTIVFDVGMNVGIASLFFARNENVSVIGFEPFARTFEQARRNIDMNPSERSRIVAYNYGLAGSNCRMAARYSFECNRLASTAISARIQGGQLEEVELRSIAEVITELNCVTLGTRLVLKLDCEGSEFEIIDALHSNDMLRIFSVILLEYHLEQDADQLERLVRQLEATGFTVFMRRTFHGLLWIGGTIHAVRKR